MPRIQTAGSSQHRHPNSHSRHSPRRARHGDKQRPRRKPNEDCSSRIVHPLPIETEVAHAPAHNTGWDGGMMGDLGLSVGLH
jgi:hypothetical protein